MPEDRACRASDATGSFGTRDAMEVSAAHAALITGRKGTGAMDIVFIGIVVGFFAITWGLVELCGRLAAKEQAK